MTRFTPTFLAVHQRKKILKVVYVSKIYCKIKRTQLKKKKRNEIFIIETFVESDNIFGQNHIATRIITF